MFAVLVAANIVVTGVALLRRAGAGLMHHTMPPTERDTLEQVLATYRRDGVSSQAVRTRRAARRSFVSLHVLVPGDWIVSEVHALADRLERAEPSA